MINELTSAFVIIDLAHFKIFTNTIARKVTINDIDVFAGYVEGLI